MSVSLFHQQNNATIIFASLSSFDSTPVRPLIILRPMVQASYIMEHILFIRLGTTYFV